jgi:protein involved in sex pheromone biosynthesis
MKKVLALVAIAGMFAFSSCGPSKEELEKKEKAKQDSIQRVNDSIAAEDAKRMEAEKRTADSIKAIEDAKAKALADSLHQDSVKRKLIKVKK